MRCARRIPLTRWARGKQYLVDVSGQFVARVAASRRRLNRELLRAASPGCEEPVSVSYSLAQATLGTGLHLEIDAKHLVRMLIGRVECTGGETRLLKHWFVGGGDWKPITRMFNRHLIFKEMHDLLRLGPKFRESPLHTAMLTKAEKGNPVVRNDITLDTPALVDAYFERYLALFDSVRRHGILRVSSNRRLILRDMASGLRNWWQGLREVDIGVAVGADGGMYRLQNAQHRCAIAILLKLPRVPVEVRLVHRDWLRRALEQHPGLPPAQAVVAALGSLNAPKS